MRRKKLITLGIIPLIFTPSIIVSSCSSPFSSLRKSHLEFYNYVDYMAKSNVDLIKESFTYSEFPDLPDLEQAINDKKIISGVGSDYFNSSLAGKGKISKIDFSKIFGITKDKSQWETELKKIYTDETFKLLDSFPLYKLDSNGKKIMDNDNQPVTDIDDDNKSDKLWEYMIPYFIQNKLIAINPFKVTSKPGQENSLKILKEGDQNSIDNLFPKKTYKGILDKLNNIGFNKLIINDYMRDNLMIGSENDNGTIFTGEIKSLDEAKNHLNGLKKSFSSFGAPNDISWIESGVDSLSSLLPNWKNNSFSKNADVAMIYNGDALYAHNGGGSDDESNKNKIRFIIPENPTFLLDGIIIPKYLEKSKLETDKIYNLLRKLFKYSTIKPENNYVNADNLLYDNFDSVNYTPTYKYLNQYVEENYFINNGINDDIGKNLLLA
ncbi:MAG: hypothetical protein HRT99_00875, partial [Mycoplasmatales bacterium]|nr:hypothetical protein [Mycoplasmatales bacterium]